MPNKIIKNCAFDSAEFKVEYEDTNRRFDDNGYLHIDNCVLTREEVSDYLGKSITSFKKLGLVADKIYGIYRPLEEIEKALLLYNDLPLTDNHIEITPINPKREKWFGHSGSLAKIEDGKLMNRVTVLVQKAINEIELATKNKFEGRKDLSVGYNYDLYPEKGNFGGKDYDFIMRNIRPNHVALVKEGRVEDATIADSKETKKLKKGINMSFSIAKFLRMRARDSKDDVKAYDEDHLREIGKGIITMAKDEDFEGKEDKLLDEITGILSELQKVQSKEKAKDNEEPKEKAKDNEESKEKAKDNEESKEKEKAEDSKESFAKIVSLSQEIMGRLNPKMIMDAKSEPIMDKVLKVKGYATDGKTFEDKLSILQNLASSKKSVPNVANDSKKLNMTTGTGKMFNPLTRKGN